MRKSRFTEVQSAQAAVRVQEAKVEKVGRLLLDNAESEYLRATLKQEEERLRALRQKIVAVHRAQPDPAKKIDVSRVTEVMRDIAAVVEADPEEARRVLADVVENVLLRPTPDGYEAEVTLKNSTAAIAGGRVLENASCGGRI